MFTCQKCGLEFENKLGHGISDGPTIKDIYRICHICFRDWFESDLSAKEFMEKYPCL